MVFKTWCVCYYECGCAVCVRLCVCASSDPPRLKRLGLNVELRWAESCADRQTSRPPPRIGHKTTSLGRASKQDRWEGRGAGVGQSNFLTLEAEHHTTARDRVGEHDLRSCPSSGAATRKRLTSALLSSFLLFRFCLCVVHPHLAPCTAAELLQ